MTLFTLQEVETFGHTKFLSVALVETWLNNFVSQKEVYCFIENIVLVVCGWFSPDF